MKIIDLPRGCGKTTRAIYLSELYNAPILVATDTFKKFIKTQAKEMNTIIPEPILTKDLRGGCFPNGIIIDEALIVLSTIIQEYTKLPIDIKVITLSTSKQPKNNNIEYIKNELEEIRGEINNLPNITIDKIRGKCNFLIEKINCLEKNFM